VRPEVGATSACASCRLGVAAGVGAGGHCPWVDGHRSAGAWIYFAGEPAERIMFVKHGMVTLSRDAGHARDDGVVWAVRRPGSLLGIEALVRPTYLDSARAVTDVVICVATREDVQDWMRTRDAAGRALLECVVHAQATDVPRRASSEGSAQQRAASWVLEQARDPQPNLPRQVVAAMLGMLPETLSRALAALAQKGLIAVTRKSVQIVDAAALELVAAGER